MNCLKISNDGLSCDKCSYRFFPSKTGECQAVPHSCSRYNRQTGECLSCYTGYYLFQGTCKQRDPLCSSTDPVTKLCNKCYNGYILYNDKCFYRGNLKTSINDSSEQLCQKYIDGACVECVRGTYYSRANKRCSLKGQHCMEFNEEEEICERCDRGYEANYGGVCVSTW